MMKWAFLSCFAPAIAFAQIYPLHSGDISNGYNPHEIYEIFDDGVTARVPTWRYNIWEYSFLTAHTAPHTALFKSGNMFEVVGIGNSITCGAANYGTVSTGGFDISCTAASGGGLEISTNTLSSTGSPILVGTDPAIEFCTELTVDQADGFQIMTVGWRTEDPAGNADDTQGTTFGGDAYDNAIGLCIFGADTAGSHDLKICERVDAGAAAITDTTNNWDTTVKTEFCTTVYQNGTYSQTIAGAAPTATAASPVAFDAGDYIWPFLRYNHDGTANVDDFIIHSWIVRYK